MNRFFPLFPAFVVLAAAAVLLISACSQHRIAPSRNTVARSNGVPPAFSVKIRSERVGSRYVYLSKRRKDGTQAYVLRSDSSVAESAGEGTGRSEFINPHIIFSGRGRKQMIADAPHAVILVKEKSLLMDGGVHALTSDGMTLNSDTLRYDEGTDHLRGRGHVLVTTPRGERLVGDRIDANLRLSEMRITHDRI
jgi:lipopolysaccharide assembly outer membrane protein LptD (OstA)